MSKTHLESIVEALDRAKDETLEAHPDFAATPLGDLLEICNGCGAAGAKFDFVPDTIYGMSIILACIIHDFDYHNGTTQKHKRRADVRFLVNMILIILANKSSWIMLTLRASRACKYFVAVTVKGGKAFWANKI